MWTSAVVETVVVGHRAWSVTFFVLSVSLLVWKRLAFPGFPSGLFGLEISYLCLHLVVSLVDLLIVSVCNRRRRRLIPLVIHAPLLAVLAISNVYFAFWQVYSTRADLVLNSISLFFHLLDLLFSPVLLFQK